jgi:hypothetical protein
MAVEQRADLVVVGGGSAGCAAAVAAARRGLDVVLVERYGFAGGTGAMVLDTFYGFFLPGARPLRVVGGVGWELAQTLMAWGEAIERPNTYGAGTGITYNPEALKVAWERKLTAAGVRLLYHRLVTDAEVADGRIERLATAGKGGEAWLRAPRYVDASGDADLAWLCGAPYESRHLEERSVQSLTTTFRVVGVDDARAGRVTHAELTARMVEAAAAGYALPRREGSIHRTPVAGVWSANMTRVAQVNPLDPWELSRAEVEGRAQAMEYVRFLVERVPGYEHARLAFLSTQIGVRESRRIAGVYTLGVEDVLSAAQFDDQIALCGAPIEEHHAGADTHWRYLPEGAAYGIPWRSLLPKGVDNLVVAGRCLAATHDAHASVRSMAQCMAMGQAAGTAWSLLDPGAATSSLDPRVLRDALAADGAIVDATAAVSVERG